MTSAPISASRPWVSPIDAPKAVTSTPATTNETLIPAASATGQRRDPLQRFCLVALNLNAFVYID